MSFHQAAVLFNFIVLVLLWFFRDPQFITGKLKELYTTGKLKRLYTQVNLMSKFDKWYIIGKFLCSTFRICNKICIFAKIEFFNRKIQLYSKIVCKNFFQKMKNYTFLKSPWPFHLKYAKIFGKILNNLIFIQEKLKMRKFSLTGYLQKICNFFRKTCAICFLMSKAFQKAKFY